MMNIRSSGPNRTEPGWGTMIRPLLVLLTAGLCVQGDVVIHAVGDVMPGAGSTGAVPSDLFDAIPQLQGADLLFGNFEGTISDDPSLAKPCRGRPGTCFRFVMPTGAIELMERT